MIRIFNTINLTRNAGAFFPSIHYVFGCWYRPDEITRRAGVFYIAAAIGTASTGFVASGVYRGLDGALGRAGWRWMFIVGGLVTIPVALFGFLTFPGTPDGKKNVSVNSPQFPGYNGTEFSTPAQWQLRLKNRILTSTR